MTKLHSIDLMDLNQEEKRKILEDMLQYLTKWLYQHILGSDTLIGKVKHLQAETATGCYCEFTPKYATGIPAVDEEHRGLFDMIFFSPNWKIRISGKMRQTGRLIWRTYRISSLPGSATTF